MKTVYTGLKRVFDLTVSGLGIALSAPLWCVIAVGIKLSSKGPVFYTTERIGKGGKPFTLYKFRSMHVYTPTEDGKKTEGGFIANADRIFKLGGILRKTKLDELPQLLNILKGEMSVVGPRPLSQASVDLHYTGVYSRITSVQPGLACLDSLYDYAHGELFVTDNEEYKAKVLPVRTELAAMYVDRRGFKLDFYCICRTVELIVDIALKKQRVFPLTGYERRATAKVFRTRQM